MKYEYERILKEIETLPSGGITYKKINGKEYAYYQWRENGKQRSRRAKDDELERLTSQIQRRKQLKNILKEEGFVYKTSTASDYNFRCAVRIGEQLDRFVSPVAGWKKRELYSTLHNYIYSDLYDRVYILYGLRRTGKTTLIRQIISEMNGEMRDKTVFMQIQDNKSLADVNQDLKYLESRGYRYVFIDEVTLLEDFIEGAALLSDVFAASGMKIVLSGTDSLGFAFTEDEELYDRCIMAHTTFIPYREFENVLGVSGIDNYICYGGTMSQGGRMYNDDRMIFSTKKSTDEYVDSAIARNIQHSLKNYQYEGHFRSLRQLYENNELTNVINRIVEDMNHRFTLEVLTKDFESSDLKISAKNLDEQKVEISDAHRYEIKEYLNLLDLTVDVENRWMSDYNRHENRTVFAQPGIRYSQAKALIKVLMDDEVFRDLSLVERNEVTERILTEIKGRMMEDIVLLETKICKRNTEVFKLQFAIGEFDMVVYDPMEGNCEIYEIKHSSKMVPAQCRYLMDPKKCAETEHRYGPIKGKYVIYRGPNAVYEDASGHRIEYLNVEEYLKSLTH